jgi:DNA-directed RNA polymerase specialized sigma24 family protein
MVQQVMRYLEEIPATTAHVPDEASGLTYEEVADYCETSVGTVKQTVSRGRKTAPEVSLPRIQSSEGNARLSEIP